MNPQEHYYLKPNVVFEPLFQGWYAWPHLIAPATAAKNITGRHLKIMNSYIQAPQMHAMAVKNPAMRGGPFMDYQGNKMEEVKHLKKKTETEQAIMLQLSEALSELEALLSNHDKGLSLNELYAQIPESLRGYVELVYDLNNNPTYRLAESLLYHSEFYDESFQSIGLWLTDNDERPFVLSTPRLNNDDFLELNIPFAHPVIDVLGSMKRKARPFSDITDLLELSPEQQDELKNLLTQEPPVPYERYTGDKIRMRYFGHACILVETKDVSILVDPLISYYGYQQEVNRFSDVDLPEVIDYVLITHNHQDHILFETLLPLRSRIKNVVVPKTNSGSLQDPNVKKIFEQIGFDNVLELAELDKIVFEDCTITGIPFIGEHCDLNIHAKICHHVQVGDFKLLFVADSCNLEPKLYQHIQKITGDVDVIFLGMECDGAPLTWLYGPLLTEEIEHRHDQSRRLAGSNFEQGKHLVDAFNPSEVYVYAMGLEPWLEFISSIKYTDESRPIIQSNMLTEYCKEKGMVAERLYGEKELLYSKYEEVPV